MQKESIAEQKEESKVADDSDTFTEMQDQQAEQQQERPESRIRSGPNTMIGVGDQNRTDEGVSRVGIGNERESPMHEAQKTMYTVTDGGQSSNADISDNTPTKVKMSRSQLEQRSLMQLKNEVMILNINTITEHTTQARSPSTMTHTEPPTPGLETVQELSHQAVQQRVLDMPLGNNKNFLQNRDMRGLNIRAQQVAAGTTGLRRLSDTRNVSNMNGLQITATAKDYTARPARPSPIRKITEPTTTSKKKLKTIGEKTPKIPIPLISPRLSNISAPHTGETMFMSSNQRSPRRIGAEGGISGSNLSGIGINAQVDPHSQSILPNIQKGDKQYNRQAEIWTAGNESSDLDQVNQKHYTQYLTSSGASREGFEYDLSHSKQDIQTIARLGDSQGDQLSIEKMAPLNVMSNLQPSINILHEDSLLKTPQQPDRTFDSIFTTEHDRHNSVQQPGLNRPHKQSLHAVKAQAEHEALIEEVRANHFKQVQQVVGPFLSKNVTSNQIETTEDQMRKRIITNTYSIKRKQMRSISPGVLRKQAGGMAVRTQMPPALTVDNSIVGDQHQLEFDEAAILSNKVRAPIQPRSQVRVPRDIIMMGIAKKQNELALRNRDRLSVSTVQNVNRGILRDQKDPLLQMSGNRQIGGSQMAMPTLNPRGGPLLLPTIAGLPSTTRNGQSININLPRGTFLEGLENGTMADSQGIGSRRYSKQEVQRTDNLMDQNGLFQKRRQTNVPVHHLVSEFQSPIQPMTQKHKGSQDFLFQDMSMLANGPAYAQSTIDVSKTEIKHTTRDDLTCSTPKVKLNFGQAMTSHIADLLEQSMTSPRDKNNLQATIDFYKRSVKPEAELNKRKEIIIKNYRLRVVDATVDLTDKDRNIMMLNKGTSIYVANSLIKPEIYRYSTKVSNLISNVFPFLNEENAQQQPHFNMAEIESLNLDEDQLAIEQDMFEKYGSQVDFEKSALREINQVREDGAPPMSAALQERHHESKILIQQEVSRKSLNQMAEEGQDVTMNQVQAAMKTTKAGGFGVLLQEDVVASSVHSYDSPGSFATQKSGNFDPEELRAVQQTEHLFEKWVRKLETAYTAPVPDRANPINVYGIDLPPPVNAINFKLMQKEGKEAMLKEKQLPVERLTAVTLFSDRPYIHLMTSVCNPEVRYFTQDFMIKTSKYIDATQDLPSHMAPVIQSMGASAAQRAITFMREQFTHLDAGLVQDGNLHADLFINEMYVRELIEDIENRKKEESSPVVASIFYDFKGKGRTRIPVEVRGYDDITSTFILVNAKKKIKTQRARIHIQLESDANGELRDAYAETVKYRKESVQYLRVTKLIQNELLRRYPYIALTEETRAKIYKSIGYDLTRNRRRTVMKVVLQVEALYVYAVLKSTLSSQRDDPFIKCMLQNFKVDKDSLALEIAKQPYKEKKDLQGIHAFKISAVRQDLDRNSGFLGREEFIQMPGANKRIVEDAIGKNKLFSSPFDVIALVAHSGKVYAKHNMNELKVAINEYPLTHKDWVKAQAQIAKHYQNLIKDKWAETLAANIWETLQKDFDFNVQSSMTEDDLDPQIFKIFNQIKQFQQSIIYHGFETGLKDYLRFLIGFAIRYDEIKNSDLMYTIARQSFINLVDDKLNDVSVADAETGITNDLTLVPRQWGPMINLEFVLIDAGKSRLKKKMKIISQPDHDDIAKEMFSVVVNMHNALKGIKRVESVVFPMLTLNQEFLQRPEFTHNAVLLNITKLIQKLLGECTKYVKATLKSSTKYVDEIFEKKTDSIILELKKQSFALENQGEEGSEDGENKKKDVEKAADPADGSKAEGADAKPAEVPVAEVEEEDSQESESDDDAGGGFQQNNMAFKSVDIDQGLMKNEIFFIRKHKWATMRNIQDLYDFGLLLLDCRPLKKDIIDHCEVLVSTLEKYLKNEFLDKMRNVKSEISNVKGRLDEKAESIDEVLSLLDYIDTLKRTDNKVAEIQIFIDNMQKSMSFIDSVQVMFDDDQYLDFLNIRNWPRSFQSWIQVRKEQLLDQKRKLIDEMKEETNQVFTKMLDFKLQIKSVLKQGLIKLTEEQRQDRVKSINDLFEGLGPKNTEKPNSAESGGRKKKDKDKAVLVQYEIPVNISFEWLAQGAGWPKKQFDSRLIDRIFNQTEELKTTFDEVNMLTIQINKRESLLGVPKTSFNELKKIQDDLKPLYELWAVASRFNNQIPSWVESQFEGINAIDMEVTVEEWVIELKRLQKTQLVESNKRQAELLEFMYGTLTYFKEYFILIKTLRSKGLVLRHWRTIGQQIGFSIDPATISLLKILALGLQEEDKLKIIKNISDIAQKEYAVQQALENLEKEMKHVEFEFEAAPDNETKLCKGIPDIESLFEEFFLRVNVLRTNPHMKNFFEKLYEIEKTVKSVIEILVDFSILQRNWLYLSGIFNRSDINKQLATEIKQFNNLDLIFKHTMKGIVQGPQVYKISHRENFLNQLKKLNQDSDGIKQGLSIFLEQKRAFFPRLYFISNEELIDVFGRCDEVITDLINNKPLAFLTNLFEGVEIVKVNPHSRKIISMCSKVREEVPLISEVATHGISPEVWLKNFEAVMIKSLREQMFMTYYEMDQDVVTVPEIHRDYYKFMATKPSHERKVRGSYLRKWLREWPSQCTYLAQQIWFTRKMVSIFESAEERKVKVAKDRKRKADRQYSDDGMSSDPDEYASVHFSDDDAQYNDMHKQGNEYAQQDKIVEQREEEEEDEGEGDDDELNQTNDDFNLDKKKKNEEENLPRFEVTLLDRLMRTRDRYLPNPSKHPGYQIEDVKKTVIQKTMILSTMLKKPLSVCIRSTVITFITILVYHRDYASKLLRERIYKVTDFGWQLYMKFDLVDVDRVFEDVTVENDPTINPFDPKITSKFQTGKSDIAFEVLQYKQEFGFEYLGSQQRLVITPLTERCQRSMLVALQYNYGGAPEGPFGTGKTETTKDLARHLAKQCYVQNSTGQIQYENILRFFKGIASAGAWLIFDEFNRLDPKILAFLSQIIIQIQNSIRQRLSIVVFDSDKIPLTFTAAVFITLNPGYAGRTELPMDLKNLFRSVSMVVPDALLISEIMLFSSGFKNAQELSKRICQVQSLANVLMQQASVVKFDFGLRAIKAIVQIAEQLKQQVQTIWESDLPDIINEDTMERVQWKGEHIIKEIQDELDPDPEDILKEAEAKMSGTMRTEENAPTKAKKQLMNQASMVPTYDNNETSDLTISEELSSMYGSETGKSQQLVSEDPNEPSQASVILDQSDESDDNQQESLKQARLRGPLFDQIYDQKVAWQKRQTDCLMKQIGLKQREKVTELELEEYIIVKAVKDYNTSKFSHDMLSSINGIITDVFLGSVPKLQPNGSNYSNLTELVFASFQKHKLDFSMKMNQKVFHLFEITQVKQGCILLGDAQSGKTTLSLILETALNKAKGNELKIRMAELRKKRLREVSIAYFEEKKLEEENPKNKKVKGGRKKTENEELGLGMGDSATAIDDDAPKKNNSKKGKKNAAKGRVQLWQDLYKKSKLSNEDVAELTDALVQRGVEAVRVNPKSLQLNELFGEVNKETYVWSEGQFTEHFRRFSLDKSTTKKWIQLDGPIDHYWVENLNSILDENKKMNLPNGETIQLSDHMCLLLETDSLSNVTPATISRCGLVFLSRDEVNRPKQMFNQYLQRLSPNLEQVIRDIENQTNWLMPECLRIFENEKRRGTLLIPKVDVHWLVSNYVQLLDSFFGGYWNDFIKQNVQPMEDGSVNPNLYKVSNAYGIRAEDLVNEDSENIEPMAILQQFIDQRLDATTGDNFQGISRRADARLAHNDFYNQESRQENCLKYLPIWSEAFLITALVWTFAPVLSRSARKQLSETLKERILSAKSDFGTYQKKKKQQAVDQASKAEETRHNSNTNVVAQAGTANAPIRRQASEQNANTFVSGGKNRVMMRKLTKKLNADGFQKITQAGLTSEFDDSVEKPLFISDYPFEDKNDIFDCYFNLDSNQWAKHDLEKNIGRMQIKFQEMIPSTRLIQNIVIPTYDSIRYNYVMELLLTTQKPIIVMGENASGKSSLIKDMLFVQTLQFGQNFFLDHCTCSHQSGQVAIKRNIERSMCVKRSDIGDDQKDDMGKTMNSIQREYITDTGRLRPEGENNKLIVYFEDLHMARTDKYGDLPGLEVLRDLFTTRAWYSSTHKSHRVIDDTNIVACIDTQAEQILRVPNRLLSRFTIVGLEGFNQATSTHIMKQLFEIQSSNWPSSITSLIPRLAGAIDELFKRCFGYMKPTPLKVHYAFNYRECFKFVNSFCRVEGNYLKNEAAMVKLFYHECIRQYADKILMRHDLKWFRETLINLVWEHFELMPNKELEVKATTNEAGEEAKPDSVPPPGTSQTKDSKQAASDPKRRVWPIDDEDNLWFSIMNMDIEGYYVEFRQPEGRHDESIESLVFEKIEGYLNKYNESPDKQKISLQLYRELNHHIIKIIRAITMHDGHVIIVGLKGYGISMMTKLACFAAGIGFNKMELHPNFVDEEWRAEMRKNIIMAASEDKPHAYVCDEYRILNRSWYKDLETLVKSNVCSDITRQADVLQALVSIQAQQQKSQNALQGQAKDTSKDKKKEEVKKKEKEKDGDAVAEGDDKDKEEEKEEKKEEKEVEFDELAFLKDQRAILRQNAPERNKLYYSFLQRVRKNFHLIFNFTPSGKDFREKMDSHKQLMLNSQMIFIQNLEFQELRQIGEKHFINKYDEEIDARVRDPKTSEQDDLNKKEREKQMNPKILKAVSLMYITTNEMAKRYQEEHGHVLYFTPVFFLRTFSIFKRLIGERKYNVTQIQIRYEKGLKKLKRTMREVQAYAAKLKEKTPIMQDKQRKLIELVVDIEEQYEKVKLQREKLKHLEGGCITAVHQTERNKEEADESLNAIVPNINEAINSMQQISKYEVSDVKTLDHPPRTIKLVMKAICILLDVEPIVKKNTKGVYKPSYWKAATGPEVLGDPQLLIRLLNYDKTQLTEEMMTRVEDILSEADYTYENAHRAFKNAAGLFRWVKAIRDYFYIFQEMQPRKDKLELSEKECNNAQKELKDKQREIKTLDHELEGLMVHQEEKQKLIDELKDKIDKLVVRKRSADTLIKGLNAEQQKWVVCTRMLNNKYDTVQGDVLISAAYIAMAGGFTQTFRLELVKEWQQCLKQANLTFTAEYSFQELFGDNAKIREWHGNQLPPDTFSTDNALILLKTTRYRLIIDPQQLAWNWMRRQYASSGLKATKMIDPGFRRTLEIAIDLGQIVLVENMNEEVDVSIESLVRREITKYGNQKMLKFCRRPMKYEPSFDLYLLTNLSKPHYDCNITNHVCMVNFFVTVEGLTQNLLSLIVANERPDLEESFNENSKATFENVKLLKDTENMILKNLSPDTKSLLENDKLINVLRESKVCAETVAEKLKKISNTNQFLQKTRMMYAPVAVRAANLYFAVTELFTVNKMYQFSMKWFFNVFNRTLKKANELLKVSEITINDEDFKLLNHKFSADERIELLIKSFTQELIRKVIFSCFQDDRQLVTYFICVKVLLAEELLDSELLIFSMTGSKQIRQGVQSPGPQIGIHWMNDVIWAELDALANIRPFSKANTMDHIIANPAVWNQLFDHKHVAFADLPNRQLINVKDHFDSQTRVIPVKSRKKKQILAIEADEMSSSGSTVQEAEDGKKSGLDHQAINKDKHQSQAQMAPQKDVHMQSDTQKVKSQAHIGNILDQNSLKSQSEKSQTEVGETVEVKKPGVKIIDVESQIDRNAQSRASSGHAATEKIWTEAELLADDDLWRVTDSSEDDESADDQHLTKKGSAAGAKQNKTGQSMKDGEKVGEKSNSMLNSATPLTEADTEKTHTRYNAYERNKDYYEDAEQLEDEAEQAARYLIEKAPGQERFDNLDRFNDMQRKTKTERKAIMLREFLLKCQCELAVQRCVRPDLMQQALHKIVGTVYDFNYLSFELDILAKFIDPDGTLAWRRSKMSTQLQMGRLDQDAIASTQVFSPPVAPKSKDSNIQQLIKEAYEESVATSPIYFLVTHSINVFDELRIFYQKNVLGHQTKLHHFQVGKGLTKTIEDAILKAAQSGDWILIENIQLADVWIDELELIIAKLDKEVSSGKFRMFLSSVQMDNCPHMILKTSVKVALEQPTGIKLRIERFIEEFARDSSWRRGPNYVFHKNMYFALAYLHSVLDSRKMFGPLGWNIYSGFDASDFQISNAQLLSYFSEPVKDKNTQIYMLKYLYANVNFSGKVSREEDLRKLFAIIEDIINVDIAQATRLLPDLSRGHYGFPRFDEDLVEWVEKQLPKQDPCEVYGFNRNSERYVLKVKSFDIMNRLYSLNKKLVAQKAVGYTDLAFDLENQSIRISLAKSSLHTQSASNAIFTTLGDRGAPMYQDDSMLDLSNPKSSALTLHKNPHPSESAYEYFNQKLIDSDLSDALLPLFVKMQKLLRKSSLDTEIKNDCDRFDEKIDSAELPMRDEYDRKISAVCAQLIKVLGAMLSERTVDLQLPYSHTRAIQNVYAIECRQYMALINAMQTDVVNLMMHIDGKYMKPLEIERLWSQVQTNLIPNSWRKYSFQTAYITLADFIIELVEKVKFWQNLLKCNSKVPAVWVPGFFDPSQYLNALRQRKSRAENIPARMIKNTYDITEIIEPSWEKCPVGDNINYIYGLWLEGASWDRETQLIVEQTNSAIYDKFPVIQVTTELMSQAEMDKLDGTLDDFEDNPPLTKKDLFEKEEADEKIKEQMEREDKLRQQLNKDQNKSKLQKERDQKQAGGGMSRMNSRAGGSQSRQSVNQRSSQQSSFNKKGTDSNVDDDMQSMRSGQSKVSKRSGSSKVSKGSKGLSRQNSRVSDNSSQNSRTSGQKSQQSVAKPRIRKAATTTKKPKKNVKGPPSGMSDLKQEFAEDSREDEESSEMSDNEEEKARKWRENIYYYACPVFRTTLRLRSGEISSDNKPVFYIKLPSLTHPRKWVKRSVALLMETYR